MTEVQARTWLLDMLDLLRRIATITPTTIDETIVEGVTSAVKNDLLWGWIWMFIGPVLNGDDHIVVSCDTLVAQEAEKAGINPATLIAIVTAIIELIKMFRNRG